MPKGRVFLLLPLLSLSACVNREAVTAGYRTTRLIKDSEHVQRLISTQHAFTPIPERVLF